MNKTRIFIVALLALLLAGSAAMAQSLKDPVSWAFSLKKAAGGQYELLATATIEPGWHIYAMTPGGEGELIGTSLSFEKDVKVMTAAKEVTPAKEEVIMDEHVRVHSGKALLSAKVAGKKGQSIRGSVEYQACNDRMCMPPKTKSFTLSIP